MRTIQAQSVGMNWRSDVLSAAQHETVKVVDLNGDYLGTVSTTETRNGRTLFRLNGERSSFKAVWNRMHDWSDIIAEQHAKGNR